MIIVITKYMGLDEMEYRSIKKSNPDFIFFRNTKEACACLAATELISEIIMCRLLKA